MRQLSYIELPLTTDPRQVFTLDFSINGAAFHARVEVRYLFMILPCTVAGWRPGQTVEVEYKNIHARGIVTARCVDADTGSGAWKCELLAEVLRE